MEKEYININDLSIFELDRFLGINFDLSLNKSDLSLNKYEEDLKTKATQEILREIRIELKELLEPLKIQDIDTKNVSKGFLNKVKTKDNPLKTKINGILTLVSFLIEES